MKLNSGLRFVCGLLIVLVAVGAKALPPISEQDYLNEFASSAFQLPDNRICAVFENNPDFSALSSSRLYFVCLKERRFTKAKPLQETASREFTYVANPRPLIINGKIWIYFNAYNDLTKEAKWGRFAFDEEDAETPIEWLNTSEVLQGQPSAWIFPALTDSGKIVLSYEMNSSAGGSDIYFSLSNKGQTFGSPVRLAESARQARFAEFYKGPWAFSYKVGTAAYVVLSADEGRSLSAPIHISAGAVIQDTFLLQRKDGDLDVYYLVDIEGKGYSLFRRKITRTGILGNEEPLTSAAVSIEKLHALRLSSGKIFLTLSKTIIANGTKTSDVVFMTLMDDAP